MVNIYGVDLSIIIVNWNVKELLRNCLNSIYEKTQGFSFEIIVVDNASTDGSVEMVSSEFPQVKLLINAENLGFAKANNLAVPFTTGHYIALLNPDTVLLNDAFRMMIEKLETEDEIGIVGPKLINSDGKVQRVCARRFNKSNNGIKQMVLNGRLTSLYFDNDEEYEQSQTVDCVTGACLILRRNILKNEYIFDPQFFMYGEDVDLCYETIQRGSKVFYLSEACVRHYGGESSKQTPLSSLYDFEAGYRLINKRYGRLFGNLYRFLNLLISAFKLIFISLVLLFPWARHNQICIRRKQMYPQIILFALHPVSRDKYFRK